MTSRTPYEAIVRERTTLSPHLVRLVLEVSDGFASTGVPDEWVALTVPGQFQTRYYTVRSLDGALLTIDVVIHDEGLVTSWAQTECVGDVVGLSAPKASFDPPPDAAWVVLAGDLTALPAMARIVETVHDVPVMVHAEVPDGPLPDYLGDVAWSVAPSGTSDLARIVRGDRVARGPGVLLDGGGVRPDARRTPARAARPRLGHPALRRDGLLERQPRSPGPGRRPRPDLRAGPRRRQVRRGDLGRLRRRAGPGMSAHKSGFACFVGRPNAGKSTLTNAIVGTKVAITSSKPQTTRTAVRGIVHRPDAQLILVDTPGLHRPRTLLGERLNDLVTSTWAEVDVVAVCFPADQKPGPGDRFLVNELAKVRRTPKIAVATKTDLVAPDALGEHLLAIQALGEETGTDWVEIVPVSAKSGDQVGLLADLLVARLPEGPPLYPDGELTDAPEEILVAELIREAALEGVRDELPHSIAVVVEEMVLREGRPADKPLLDVHANLFVERSSQKGIVIGHRGARLRDVGIAARQQIQALLGTPVHLDLHVKIAKDWQRDPRQLRKLGF